MSELELPPEVSDRIATAVQRAVLSKIAELDLAPQYFISLSPTHDRNLPVGATDGIWVSPVKDESNA